MAYGWSRLDGLLKQFGIPQKGIIFAPPILDTSNILGPN